MICKIVFVCGRTDSCWRWTERGQWNPCGWQETRGNNSYSGKLHPFACLHVTARCLVRLSVPRVPPMFQLHCFDENNIPCLWGQKPCLTNAGPSASHRHAEIRMLAFLYKSFLAVRPLALSHTVPRDESDAEWFLQASFKTWNKLCQKTELCQKKEQEERVPVSLGAFSETKALGDDSCHHSYLYPNTNSVPAKHSHPILITVRSLKNQTENLFFWLSLD